MSDLNVTGGEWEIDDCTRGDGSIRVMYGNQLLYYFPNTDLDYRAVGNAYLIAQAKNMYEMLSGLLLAHKNEFSGGFLNPREKNEIEQILNACKPPEEK